MEDSAADYLSKTNWKVLVEYLTAEIVFNRPDNPIAYCRDLLIKRTSGGNDSEFNAQDPTEWLKHCYSSASKNVDNNGVLKTRSNTVALPAASSVSDDSLNDLKKKINGLEKLLDASTTIATLDPLQATDNIITETCRILDCDRATIFTIDFATKELVLQVAEGAKDIRIPVGQGIAGTVAASGETINIADAYSDSRFSAAADKASGYHTKSILCMPIFSLEGQIIGVLQAINKENDEVFGSTDEEVMRLLAVQAGIALRNATLYYNSESAREKFRSLLDIIHAMQGDMGINSLIFTITQRTIRVVDADRCTLYLLDNVSKSLFAMQGEVNIKISMGQGIAGSVASSGITLNIFDAYQNDKFNQAIDKKTGYRTKAILCMPIKADGNVIGVLQLINKRSGSYVFTQEDEDVMNIFLSIGGPILAASNLYSQLQGKGNKKKDEGQMPAGASNKVNAAAPRLTGFAEGEEGEEEEEEEVH